MVLNENQNKIREQRERRQMEKKKIQEVIYMSKREEAKQGKKIMHENEQKRNLYMSMVAKENQAKMLTTKRQERIAILKKQEVVSRKQREAREELDKQIEHEERMIKTKEQEVMEMELLEMELIKKLQST